MNIIRRIEIKFLVLKLTRAYKKYGTDDYRFRVANRQLTKVICK